MEVNEILVNNIRKLDLYLFFRTMFRSCQNSNIRKCWIEYAESNFKNLGKESIGKLTDAFFKYREIHTFDQIILFHRILEIVDPKNIPLRKLLLSIKQEKKYFFELSWLDMIFQKFLGNLCVWAEIHQDELKVYEVFSVLRRLEYSGAYFYPAAKVAKKLYSLSKARLDDTGSSIMQPFSLYMIDKGLLSLKDAIQLYQESKNNDIGSHITAKSLAYVLLISPEHSDELLESAKDCLRKFDSRLKPGDSSRQILTNLSHIMRFPPRLLEAKKEFYLSHLRESIKDANHDAYTNIFESIPAQYLTDHTPFYEPFMNELLQNYSYASNRILPGQIMNVLNKISLYGKIDNVSYNLIMVDIEKWFNSFKPEQYHQIIKYLVRLRLRETNLFDKIVHKIESSPLNYVSKIGEIIFDFFVIVHNTEATKNFVTGALLRDNIRNSSMIPLACYIAMANLKNEKELLEILFSKLKESNVQLTALKRAFFVYDFVRFVYKEKTEWIQILKDLSPDFESEYKNYAALFKGPNKDREYVEFI
jgi:hypothetical protein